MYTQTKKRPLIPLGYEPIGKLIGKFAVPCVVSLVVNSLYNIVDQIFIGRGVGYLGNGATNIVFPITVITLAIALMIGDGGASYLSLKLGEGAKAKAGKGIGNAIVVVMAVNNNLLATYGAQSIYGAEIPITAMGIVVKVNQIMIAIVVGIAAGAQPIIGYNYGAGQLKRVKKTLKWTVLSATIVTTLFFIAFQFSTQSIISLFGSEDALYNEFAAKCFRIFLLACILNGFQTVSSIFMQAIGKPAQSAVLSLSRQIVVLVPASLFLSRLLGVEGVLWAGPAADTIAFVLAAFLLTLQMRKLRSEETLERPAPLNELDAVNL